MLGKRVQREEVPLHPRGLAPKRMRELHTGQEGQGKQQQKKGGKGRGGAEQRSQGHDEWSMPGFSVSPGSAMQAVVSYSVQAVQTQVTLQGTAGRKTWLGVDLLRGGWGGKVTGWMQSSELLRRAAGNVGWLARLRGRGGKDGVWRITAGCARAQQCQSMDREGQWWDGIY